MILLCFYAVLWSIFRLLHWYWHSTTKVKDLTTFSHRSLCVCCWDTNVRYWEVTVSPQRELQNAEIESCSVTYSTTQKRRKKSSLSSSEQAASLRDIKPTEIHLWCSKSNLPSISSFLRETQMSESASQILRLYLLLMQTPKSAELNTLLDCDSDRLKEPPLWAEGAHSCGLK